MFYIANRVNLRCQRGTSPWVTWQRPWSRVAWRRCSAPAPPASFARFLTSSTRVRYDSASSPPPFLSICWSCHFVSVWPQCWVDPGCEGFLVAWHSAHWGGLSSWTCISKFLTPVFPVTLCKLQHGGKSVLSLDKDHICLFVRFGVWAVSLDFHSFLSAGSRGGPQIAGF